MARHRRPYDAVTYQYLTPTLGSHFTKRLNLARLCDVMQAWHHLDPNADYVGLSENMDVGFP